MYAFSQNKLLFLLFQHVAFLGVARKELAAFCQTRLSFPNRYSQEALYMRNESGAGRDMGDILTLRLILLQKLIFTVRMFTQYHGLIVFQKPVKEISCRKLHMPSSHYFDF